MAIKKKITVKQTWFLIVGAIIILVFSYNAFSYDLFNYMFDAKILAHYGQNPFLHRPLDFAGDPWLNFMRWTHRYYPYGPSWLVLTVPLSFIGMNYFLATFFLYKLLMTFSFFGSCYLIYKISEKIFPESSIFNLIFFGLNPLILIEGLVSAHNDMPMTFFTLLFFYLFITKKYYKSAFFYLFSVGIKYATVVLLPVVAYLVYVKRRSKHVNWEKIFIACTALSLVAIVIATVRTTFQPWYLLYVLPFTALVSKKLYVFIPAIVSTIIGLTIYIPYVYLTDYDKSYPLIISKIEIVGLFIVFISFISPLLFSLRKSSK